jgi:hypothetical protein
LDKNKKQFSPALPVSVVDADRDVKLLPTSEVAFEKLNGLWGYFYLSFQKENPSFSKKKRGENIFMAC